MAGAGAPGAAPAGPVSGPGKGGGRERTFTYRTRKLMKEEKRQSPLKVHAHR